jgi:hypothetical protein
MPLNNVLELSDVLLVLRLKKLFFRVSYMGDPHWKVAFEGKHCTINDCNLPSLKTLARCVRTSFLYIFLVDTVSHVHYIDNLEEPSIFEEEYAKHASHDATPFWN